MSGNFVQNGALRSLMLGAYRLYARGQLWRSGPRVFVNSIPKAGTHLLTAELEKFGALQNSRLHVTIPRVTRGDERTATGAPHSFDAAALRRDMATVRPGQIFSAHLPWTSELESLVREADVRAIFMMRDPRAILVSRLHYVVGLRRHRLHDFLTGGFATDEERYHALIDGHDSPPYITSLGEILADFLPWTTARDVLPVRFEDLVGEAGGGTTEAKRQTLARIARHCGLDTDALDSIALSSTKATPTLRKGHADAWREELPPAIARRITEDCGNMLEAFGYPAD